MAARYEASPVGPYQELSVAEPVRAGRHVGLSVTFIMVSTEEAAAACRATWGLPAEAAEMRWSEDGDERALHWEDAGVEVRGRPWWRGIPAALPVRSLQAAPDGPVVLPRSFRATRVTLAKVEITVPPGHRLAHLAGSHPGAVMAGVRVEARSPRRLSKRAGAPRRS